MSTVQQKDLKQPESFHKNQENTNKPRLVTTSNATETETKNSAANRVNTQQMESRVFSPPLPSQITTGISKGSTANQNRMYYSQAYGKQEQGLTVYYNEISPGQIHRKPIEQLEYENGVLIQQLQERDQIIAMYKAGWAPQAFPINDELVKSLNLQLAQKNVLIEQFHRSLAQFEETVKRQHIKLSAICIQQFHRLQTLIIRHQHYPILITQRLIETSRHAETIYIKDMTIIQEYMYKLEQSYKEVTILRQKIIWFQKQYQNLEGVIGNLRVQLEQTQHQNASYIQEINNLRIQIQQFQGANQGQISQYQAQINALKQRIAQLEAQSSGSGNQLTALKQQINVYITQINNYKQQINVYITQINTYKSQILSYQNQINSYKQQINLYITEINTYKQQISVYQTEINGYKQQIGSTQNRKSEEISEINGLKQQISIYITEINSYKQEITMYQNEIANWKAQFTSMQNENGSLKQQINVYITQINNYKVQIQNLSLQINGLKGQLSNKSEIQGYKQQINSYSIEISSLQQKISLYISEINSYKQQITMLQTQIENLRRQASKTIDCGHSSQISSYKQQITSLTLTIQQDATRYKEEIERLNIEINRLKKQSQSNANLEHEVEILRQKIFAYEQEISNLNRKINSQYDMQWEIDNLKRENQRLKTDNTKLKNDNYLLEEQINRLNQEIIKLKGRISRLESQSNDQTLQWKLKYQESQTIIRKLRIQIEQYTVNINNGNEWKTKYENLEIKYKQLISEIEYYKLEYKNIQDKLTAQEKSLREQLESQFNYKLQLLEQRLRIQIREEIEITLRTQISNKLRTQWQGRLNESYQNLRQAQQYIKTLLAKIEELQLTIETLNLEIINLKNRSILQPIDISPYERRIKQLELELERLRGQNDELKRQLQDAEYYIIQLQQQLKNRPETEDTTSFNITIDELTIQIKQLLTQISVLTEQRQEYQLRYKQLESTYHTNKTEFELTIKRLNQQIEALRRELAQKADNSKEWEREKKELVEKYERELKQRWDQLKQAEEYIANYTKQSQEIIAYLEQRVKELEGQLNQQQNQIINDQYLYKIDARYQEIRKRILAISTQTTQSITTESEYWQSYRQKRKQQIQTIQQTINQSLTYMSQIEQAIIVKRQQLHRLDLTKLDTILHELENIQRGKGQLQGAIKQQYETRFYGVLKSVSTTIRQQ